ncbi:MAG: branched-chain amino acid transaminase [Alphaproteobacteria bacterium]|nr:branched-chain amino acid transaminase [Alphaproteobacteria bacterium]MCB9792116.1 branched-chain amino acid transaminase [Alphaproteobacteria bacterium]
MSVRSDVIWMDGAFVPFDEAKVHVLSHTLHYGLGVFEGIRCYEQPNGKPGVFRLDEHLRRLFDSAKMCLMEIPFSYAEVRQACMETISRNGLKDAYIRPLVYLGSGAMGLGAKNQVHVSIAVWKWGAYMGEEGLNNGIKAGTSSFTRHAVNSNLQRAKVIGHYVNSILARYEANDNGYQEAIMLDHNGYVAEGTGENLFAIRDGLIKTPSVTNILGGITRKSVIEILQHEGYEVRETMFGRDALYIADEVFMTGTAAEVTPIREIDRRTVGTGSPGPITKMVQDVYLSGVRGKVDWMRGWITVVD